MRKALATTMLSLVTAPVVAAPVTIMAYNVENLFDIEDDATNPHDNTYLPLATKQQNAEQHDALCRELNSGGFFLQQCLALDWSEAVYQTKLKRISAVLQAMGKLPDILVLEETENRKVVDDLVAEIGAGAFPTIVALDSSDEPISRGIDVAIVSKFPLLGEPVAHVVDFGSDADDCGATRDIIEASFALPDGESLTVLGVHFPSQGNPPECRIRAFQQLSQIKQAKGSDALVLAAGDFNFECSELASPLYARLTSRGNWYVPAVITAGCSAPGSSKFFDGLLEWNTWSFLDQIIVSPSLSPSQPSDLNWFADMGSFQTVVVSPEQVMVDESDDGYVEPRRFDSSNGTGVSDHWPVLIRLMNRREAAER